MKKLIILFVISLFCAVITYSQEAHTVGYNITQWDPESCTRSEGTDSLWNEYNSNRLDEGSQITADTLAPAESIVLTASQGDTSPPSPGKQTELFFYRTSDGKHVQLKNSQTGKVMVIIDTIYFLNP